MPKVQVDFTGAGSEGFALLPKDNYRCYVFDAKVTTTAAKNTMVKLTLKVATGPFKGRQLWFNIVLSSHPFALERARTAIGNLLGTEMPKSLAEFDTDDLLGKSCIAVVDHRVAKVKDKTTQEEVSKTVEDVTDLLKDDNSDAAGTGDDDLASVPF